MYELCIVLNNIDCQNIISYYYLFDKRYLVVAVVHQFLQLHWKSSVKTLPQQTLIIVPFRLLTFQNYFFKKQKHSALISPVGG